MSNVLYIDQTPSNTIEYAEYFVGVLKGVCLPDEDRGDHLEYEIGDGKVTRWTLEVESWHIDEMRKRFDFKFGMNEDCWSTDFWDIRLK